MIANGEKAYHLSPMVHNLTNDITILTQGKKDFGESQLQKLAQTNISIVEKEIVELMHKKGNLEKVIFKDGSEENFDAAYAYVPFEQSSNIPQVLGCQLTELGISK